MQKSVGARRLLGTLAVMTTAEAKDMVIDASRSARVVELLSRRPPAAVAIVAALIVGAIASYSVRTLGLSQTAAYLFGISCGTAIALLVDLITIRLRMLKALDILTTANDG